MSLSKTTLINPWEQITLFLRGLSIISVGCIPWSWIVRVDTEEERDKCYEHFYSLWKIIARWLPRSVLSFNTFTMPLRRHKSTSFFMPLWALAVRPLEPLSSIRFRSLLRVKGFAFTWGFVIMAHRIGWAELNPCYLQFTKYPLKYSRLCITNYRYYSCISRVCGSGNHHQFSSAGYWWHHRQGELKRCLYSGSGVGSFFCPQSLSSVMLFSHHHSIAYTILFYILMILWILFGLVYEINFHCVLNMIQSVTNCLKIHTLGSAIFIYSFSIVVETAFPTCYCWQQPTLRRCGFP